MGSDKVQTERDEDLETDDLSIFLQELVEYNSDYELQPGEFTVNSILDVAPSDIDRGRVTTDMHNRVKRGELDRKKCRVGGRSQWVFWRKNPAD